MEIIRWRCLEGKDDFERMDIADNGAWVRYEDYKSEVKYLKRLLRQFQTALLCGEGAAPIKEK